MRSLMSVRVGVVLFLVVVAGIAAWLVLRWPFLPGLAVLLGLWMVITRRGRQARSVTGIGVSTLPGRLGASSVVAIGIAGVVAVLVAMLAMAEGYRETLRKSGSEDTAIVMRGASAAEGMSTPDNASVKAIEQTPAGARADQGRALRPQERRGGKKG